jgi:AAA domain
MSLTMPDELAEAVTAGKADDLAALDYTHYPVIERRWRWKGYVPVGTPVIYAAAGGTGKGMLFAAVAARTVLGLPFPGEDPDARPAPGRVVWISGPGEDDQFEDLAPRLRAAIAAAVEEFGLDPALASEKGAIRFIHDLSAWPDDEPVTLPADCPRVLAEIGKVNKRAEKCGEPLVAMVVADSLSAVLSPGYTIDSRQGAVRTMVKLGRFARRADVAFPILHHLTKDKKATVAGSAGVLNSIRLAFVIERAADNEDIRVITPHKFNITEVTGQRYRITGGGGLAHAEFVDATDARAERIEAARGAAVPEPGTLRARVAAAADDPGPFRVLRMARTEGSESAPPQRVGTPQATRAQARALADGDAGQVLTWTPRSEQGQEGAGYRRGATSVAYLVTPVRTSKAT